MDISCCHPVVALVVAISCLFSVSGKGNLFTGDRRLPDCSGASGLPSSQTVALEDGKVIQGVRRCFETPLLVPVHVYSGIRYASLGDTGLLGSGLRRVAQHRFRQAVAEFLYHDETGLLNKTLPGPVCPQPESRSSSTVDGLSGATGRQRSVSPQEENCLTLNIFVPERSKPLMNRDI
ncbi:unnamed protein product [Protopolystoma xenopodis]|uniref:Carboxylesterase type B domain-containing protein n=1 Tax=Protopolystoma xenopodis TaxID=117903 RepID=A0A3S5C3T8_9PLAT|nr:unnamed protein product [Protopolystoma xenopodis]